MKPLKGGAYMAVEGSMSESTYQVNDKNIGTVLATGLSKEKALWLVKAWGATMEKEKSENN